VSDKPKSTGTYNTISKDRDAELHELIETTLMSVLAALFESNVVKRVNMGKVVSLFGLDYPDLNDTWISFDDPEFLIGYSKFKVNQLMDREKNIKKTKRKDKLKSYYDDPNRTLH